MSNVRTSYSQINKYLFCSQAHAHHYKNKYRPLELSSALPFGNAFGKALEWALNDAFNLKANEKQEITEADRKNEEEFFQGRTELDARDIFDYNWKYQYINGNLTRLDEYPHLAYSKYDMDKDLANTPYESLRVKAHLMLETFYSELLPQIEHVYSTEEKTQLENDEGDSNIGFADAVVKLKDYHKPVILDFKTASRAYTEDSVRNSVQLAGYLHVLSEKYDNTRLAGYAVFLKNIEKNKTKVCKRCGHDGTGGKHKTCNADTPVLGSDKTVRCEGEWIEKIKPRAMMQLIVDGIPERTEEMVVDNIAAVNDAIKSGIVTKNLSKCDDAGYGRPCEYRNLCWSGDTIGLVKLDDQK
jgi:hypothetical protein